MGLFERTKHLERLASEIANQNLRHLGSKEVVDEAQTRQQVLELEAILREYRLNLDEAEARRELSQRREQDASEEAGRWNRRTETARARGRPELADQAVQRAQVYEREREAASADSRQQADTIGRLRAEIVEVERRIAVLRALRLGSKPSATMAPLPAPGTATQRLILPPRDPLEEAFEELEESESEEGGEEP